jgi:hypothetical protein
MFGIPPPPHVSGASQVPHSIVAPQPSSTASHSARASAQVMGTHGPPSAPPLGVEKHRPLTQNHASGQSVLASQW